MCVPLRKDVYREGQTDSLLACNVCRSIGRFAPWGFGPDQTFHHGLEICRPTTYTRCSKIWIDGFWDSSILESLVGRLPEKRRLKVSDGKFFYADRCCCCSIPHGWSYCCCVVRSQACSTSFPKSILCVLVWGRLLSYSSTCCYLVRLCRPIVYDCSWQ